MHSTRKYCLLTIHAVLPGCGQRICVHHHTADIQDACEQLEDHPSDPNPETGTLIFYEIQVEAFLDRIFVDVVFHPDPEIGNMKTHFNIASSSSSYYFGWITRKDKRDL